LLGSSGKRILVVNPDGSELAYLPNRWAYDRQCDRDRLSPDGAYAVIQAEGRHGLDLFVMALPGGSTSQLTFVGKGKAYDPAWSPDGRRIVFASNQETDDDIFVVEFGDPRAPRPRTIKLTHDDWESDKHPSYSPDGTQIVFCSNKSGRRQIWVMNADGSEPRQLVDIDADCWDPVWIKP
jgi:TolB protein